MNMSKKNRSTQSVVTVACPAGGDPFASAYAAIGAEVAAVAPEKARGYSLDAVYAASVAQTAVARCAKVNAALWALPGHDAPPVQMIGTYALALLYTHAQVLAGSAPTDALAKQCNEAAGYIDRFGAVTQMFVAYGALDPKVLEPVRTQRKRSYREAINALLAYAVVIEQLREKFGDKMMVSVEEVAKVRELAAAMLGSLGARVNAKGTREHWIEQRARVAALLVRAYTELRRCVEFVRFHEGDAGEYVPSLYVSGSRGTTAAEGAGDEEEGGEGDAPTDDDGGSASPIAKGPEGSKSAKGAAVTKEDDDGPHGPPGSSTNPFLR